MEEVGGMKVGGNLPRDLKCFVEAFNIPKGYKLLLDPAQQDRVAYPPPGYVAISHQHLQAGVRLLGFSLTS
ncbi:hypothetical protein ACOSQ2_017014 [Xanthoceras sorbifolium]